MAEQISTFELPASAEEIRKWVQDLPAGAQIEATVYSSFKKDTGKTKVQRLVAHYGTAV